MSHLYLPSQHDDTDLALAGAIAEAIDSNELFVAWTCAGGTTAAPDVQAVFRTPEPTLRNPLAEAVIEIVAAFTAVANLLFFRGSRQPADEPRTVRASRSELEEAA